MSDDVSHLVKTAIIHFLQRVHNPALHRLEAVFNTRYGALKNYIGCVVEKPVLVQSVKRDRMNAFVLTVACISRGHVVVVLISFSFGSGFVFLPFRHLSLSVIRHNQAACSSSSILLSASRSTLS